MKNETYSNMLGSTPSDSIFILTACTRTPTLVIMKYLRYLASSQALTPSPPSSSAVFSNCSVDELEFFADAASTHSLVGAAGTTDDDDEDGELLDLIDSSWPDRDDNLLRQKKRRIFSIT